MLCAVMLLLFNVHHNFELMFVSIQHWAVNRTSWVPRVSKVYRLHPVHPTNVGSMLGQRRRRWPGIGPVHCRCSDRTAEIGSIKSVSPTCKFSNKLHLSRLTFAMLKYHRSNIRSSLLHFFLDLYFRMLQM